MVGAGAPVPVRVIAAGTRVHGCGQKKICRKFIISVDSGNINLSLFQRLAQDLQGCSGKFRQFIQKQNTRQTCGTIKQEIRGGYGMFYLYILAISPPLNCYTPSLKLHPSQYQGGVQFDPYSRKIGIKNRAILIFHISKSLIHCGVFSTLSPFFSFSITYSICSSL